MGRTISWPLVNSSIEELRSPSMHWYSLPLVRVVVDVATAHVPRSTDAQLDAASTAPIDLDFNRHYRRFL